MLTGIIVSEINKVRRVLRSTYHLFFDRKFEAHRIGGLIYLIQWIAAFCLYFYDYQYFINSPLVITLPLNGVIQSISATFYFRFLRKQKDGGLLNETYSLSYNFIVENIFYSGILFYQWMYMSDYRTTGGILTIIENIMVFFPYAIIRPFFPKTSFTDYNPINAKQKSRTNRIFWNFSTYLTKYFYIWAKHYIGYFLNYLRFLDLITATQQYHIFLMAIFACFSTTIGVFLHTLAFKGYINRKLSFIIYAVSYMMTFYSWTKMLNIFYDNKLFVLLAGIGVACNFRSRYWQIGWQLIMFTFLSMVRYEYIDISKYMEIL